VVLTTAKTIASNEVFKSKYTPNGIDRGVNFTTYRSNYAFSMWVYLNQQSNVAYSKETNVFHFGNGCPTISYVNDIPLEEGVQKSGFKFYLSKDVTLYIMSAPLQKWNNFFINYYNNSVDVFINGVLEKTVQFSEMNRPSFTPNDTVITGEDGGLDGAICNVLYYPQSVIFSQIKNSFQLLKNKNPPL
jgi:hypothetical protein